MIILNREREAREKLTEVYAEIERTQAESTAARTAIARERAKWEEDVLRYKAVRDIHVLDREGIFRIYHFVDAFFVHILFFRYSPARARDCEPRDAAGGADGGGAG